jgi:hypothetical protein
MGLHVETHKRCLERETGDVCKNDKITCCAQQAPGLGVMPPGAVAEDPRRGWSKRGSAGVSR